MFANFIATCDFYTATIVETGSFFLKAVYKFYKIFAYANI